MNDQRCLVCKYLGDHEAKTLCKDRIHRESGQDIILPLCYGHSWELFRYGQRKFLAKYRNNFMNSSGTDPDSEFIKYVSEISKKSFDSLMS